jgi:glycosyltransferase involved in cell wall biosynthesis
MRISYIPGPGDVVGTYGHWKKGEPDPRVPIVTYSSMLYTLAAENGYHLQVITPQKAPSECDHWLTFSTEPRPDGVGNYWTGEYKRARSIRRKLEDYSPDIVIVSTDVPAFFLYFLHSSKWKLCIAAHNTYWLNGRNPFSGFKSWLKYNLMKFNMGFVDGAVCTSRECARQIGSMTSREIPILTQIPIPRRSFQPNASCKARRIVFLGRIERNKGIFLLADAVNELSALFPDVTCVFAGSGEADKEFSDYLVRLDNKNIKFVGRLCADDVHDLLHASDLLVVPTMTTFNEGLAVVGFEAAVHLVPSIFSDVVPAHEYFEGGCLVFEADSYKDLKEKIESVLADDALYLRLRDNLKNILPYLLTEKESWGIQVSRLINRLDLYGEFTESSVSKTL